MFSARSKASDAGISWLFIPLFLVATINMHLAICVCSIISLYGYAVSFKGISLGTQNILQHDNPSSSKLDAMSISSDYGDTLCFPSNHPFCMGTQNYGLVIMWKCSPVNPMHSFYNIKLNFRLISWKNSQSTRRVLGCSCGWSLPYAKLSLMFLREDKTFISTCEV